MALPGKKGERKGIAGFHDVPHSGDTTCTDTDKIRHLPGSSYQTLTGSLNFNTFLAASSPETISMRLIPSAPFSTTTSWGFSII